MKKQGNLFDRSLDHLITLKRTARDFVKNIRRVTLNTCNLRGAILRLGSSPLVDCQQFEPISETQLSEI
jgi:hypothetical protein